MSMMVSSVAGLIPAHAGKTLCCSGGELVAGAHPRSRGENMSPSESDSTATGSSPLTRGKLGRFLLLRLSRGLIPAHAGKT